MLYLNIISSLRYSLFAHHVNRGQVDKAPRSLGWQELLFLPYGSVAWIPNKIELSILSNDAVFRDGYYSFYSTITVSATQVRLNLINAKDIVSL